MENNKTYGIMKIVKSDYGFAKEHGPRKGPDNGKNVYFIHKNKYQGNWKDLKPGSVISFEPDLSDKRGPAGINVRLEGE